MKSQDELVDHVAARIFAVNNGIVGAGWGLSRAPKVSPVPDHSNDLKSYLTHAKLVFPNDNRYESVADIFANQMKIGDYCWMYTTHTGEYWCCKIEGEFEYRTGGDFELYGLHLTRRCTWVNAGPADAVPGMIRRAFAGPFGTVTRLVTDSLVAIEASDVLFKLKQPAPNGDLISIAAPEDLEDLVALYLQEQGWSIFPSTAKVATASYEFVLVHNETGKRAGVQVKSGNIGYLDQYVAQDFDEFFVFMANATAIVTNRDNRISRIERNEIEAFARRCWTRLPRRLQAQWPIA